MVRIYAITDPETNFIRYVGKTSNFLTERMGTHWKTASRKPRTGKGDNSPLYQWLRGIQRSGKPPSIELLMEVDDAEADEWERRFIRMACSISPLMLNHNHNPEEEACGTCPRCGEGFSGPRTKKYCSARCGKAERKRRRRLRGRAG